MCVDFKHFKILLNSNLQLSYFNAPPVTYQTKNINRQTYTAQATH